MSRAVSNKPPIPTAKLWTLTPRHHDNRRNNEAGRQFADQVLSDMQKTGNDSRLQAVLRDVILRGEYDATHVGFVQRISELAKMGYTWARQGAQSLAYICMAVTVLNGLTTLWDDGVAVPFIIC